MQMRMGVIKISRYNNFVDKDIGLMYEDENLFSWAAAGCKFYFYDYNSEDDDYDCIDVE